MDQGSIDTTAETTFPRSVYNACHIRRCVTMGNKEFSKRGGTRRGQLFDNNFECYGDCVIAGVLLPSGAIVKTVNKMYGDLLSFLYN